MAFDEDGSGRPDLGATALMFPGQGGQAEGMDEPYRDTERYAEMLEILGTNPFERLDEGTRWHQPAIFACSVFAWEAAGRPRGLVSMGHSLGEFAALVAGGALDFSDALRLVELRGRVTSEAAEASPGSMVAVLGGDYESVAPLAEEFDVTLANDNAPGQIVFSGDTAKIDQLAEKAGEIGLKARVLAVTGAFHSPAVAPAVPAMREALAGVEFREPEFTVLSCATAEPFTDPAEELALNIARGVRWVETVRAAAALGATDFEEFGHGRVLGGLVRRIDPVASTEGRI